MWLQLPRVDGIKHVPFGVYYIRFCDFPPLVYFCSVVCFLGGLEILGCSGLHQTGNLGPLFWPFLHGIHKKFVFGLAPSSAHHFPLAGYTKRAASCVTRRLFCAKYGQTNGCVKYRSNLPVHQVIMHHDSAYLGEYVFTMRAISCYNRGSFQQPQVCLRPPASQLRAPI